ncbi:LacI family DNA-binding transcriptional regulator [Desulforamulus hydrothermalis]|uniref:Putative DNA-binding transcriptional regulator n=1 Tax=Desulforamulus hydrothermalis Lam5 = DSM 18033 TaxID=1121428 RepID=K8DYQ5_9FIRM|nr:LacI family DNA-binding transcriptional regulator [Desulforamulus hydrothermalis]CCO07915.1 putative DNA-binding transcriptional regulator [Desulforamulus hydrothermalis Lam5 = DSM 18033]SHH34639.1 transcriptional regulator, LacI family [Desulforamulus hydrothermalis Lam5 = DSM 18033]
MATIKDVAKLAGVSVSTVSRVLNASGYVDKTTEERVMAAIKQLHYKPSQIARGLVSKKTKTFGLILPDITNPFFPELARGVEDEAQRHGYNIMLCNSDWDIEKEKMYLSLLQAKCVDGIILVGSRLREEYLAKLLGTLKVPMVLLDRSSGMGIHSISANNNLGGYLATKHLVDQGYRTIAHISGPQQSPSGQQRLAGYKNALAEGNIPYDEVLVTEGDYRISGGAAAMRRLLRLSSPPDAVFCANDLMAIGALEVLQETGVKVPDEIALVGYDGIHLSKYVFPKLTTIIQPTYHMGTQAVQIIIDNLVAGQTECKHIELDPILEIRDSSIRRKPA